MTAPTLSTARPALHPSEFRIGDFDHFVQLFSGWDGRFEQLSCGRFEGTLRVARGQQLHAHLATGNQAIRVRGRERPGVFTIALVLPESAGCVWQGRRLDAGCLVVRHGDVEVDHRTSKRAVNMSVVLSEEVLLQTAWRLTRTDPKPISWLAVQPPPDVFGRLDARVKQFLAESAGSRTPDAHEADWIEQACLTAVAEAVFPMTDSRRIDIPLRARAGLVRRAEELMCARLQTLTGESDLCAMLGASGRTLRLAFRERFGLGPMAYFQTLRLHAARAALKNADPDDVSVAGIARRLGFFHLGKFAGYYRRLFGELPSVTCLLSRQKLVPISIVIPNRTTLLSLRRRYERTRPGESPRKNSYHFLRSQSRDLRC